MSFHFGPDNPATYVSHAYPEMIVDLGEVKMNYVVAGDASAPPLLLIPGQTESWWGYEAAIKLLEPKYRVYAIDLRGQGRSSRTPGRYTFDNFGNDVVRFIQLVIKKPTIVAGNSSGGVISAWLAAYAPPGLIRGVYLEDPPLFSSDVATSYGPGIKQINLNFQLQLFITYLGDQWKVGDWQGLKDNKKSVLPEFLFSAIPDTAEPPQNLKEYDPEWGRAFMTGSVTASSDHKRLLESIKVPVLFSHHMNKFDAESGIVNGASTDNQANHVRKLIEGTGQSFVLKSLPDKPHQLHHEQPEFYVSVLELWAKQFS